ncbi:T-cell receptor alpha chain V region RL-5 [Anabarilius grahami]|nr:T-cell receptor alpha chain V region RL-5 [Anabarilius grahami]
MNNLQWYRQYPNSEPEFLILIMESGQMQNATPPHPRLTASVDKGKKTVNLEIFPADVKDSALYYCALQPTVAGNTMKSGDKVTLSCNHSSALSLYWYRQYPRSSPHCLLLILQNSGESQIMQPGMSVKLNEKKTSVYLEISSVKVSDSAVYYCALKPTVRGNPTAPYKNLNLA